MTGPAINPAEWPANLAQQSLVAHDLKFQLESSLSSYRHLSPQLTQAANFFILGFPWRSGLAEHSCPFLPLTLNRRKAELKTGSTAFLCSIPQFNLEIPRKIPNG
jgi:hypothetical protein